MMVHPILSLRGLGAAVLENEPMSAHTTFKIGGPARFFVQVPCHALAEAVRAAQDSGLKYIIIGNGSNLLCGDHGFDGVVFRLAPEAACANGNIITVPAGAMLSSVAALAAQASLTGLEFAHGIPGTAGGAVFMNAGAYGGQISDVLLDSEYIDLSAQGEGVLTLGAAEHHFAYRESLFCSNPDWIITRSRFELLPGVRQQIEQKMTELAASRREKQPLNLPSAGSAYKRPEGHFAGRLIEDCGLKGYSIGGAQVSEKHAGFIVNRGGATCRDVLALMEHIEREVERRFGVRLEREVRLVGDV